MYQYHHQTPICRNHQWLPRSAGTDPCHPSLAFTSKCLCSLLSHRFSACMWSLGKTKSLLSEDALFALSIWLLFHWLCLVCKRLPPHFHPTESSRAISSMSLSLPIQSHQTPFLSLSFFEILYCFCCCCLVN